MTNATESGHHAVEFTTQSAPDRTLTETDHFLETVLVDGRFINEVGQRPREMARRLGLTVSDATANELTSTPREVLVLRLFERQYGPKILERQAPGAEMLSVPFVLGIVAIGIIAVIAVIWAVTYYKDPRELPVDHSPNRDAKL